MCGQFKRQSIFDQIETINQIIVINLLQNWNHMYYNHCSTIKCVGFKPIHYTINVDIVSSSIVFSKFDSVFLSNVLLVIINKNIFLFKKKKNCSN